ncbi:MAG: GNAT family N-acetyltransferase [Holosporales bacterium]|jgi:ribosomal protein S18 acetylase RimI-like enzyme|nr:GNAT family N-acetyltransferase [Holosporales bacterium]
MKISIRQLSIEGLRALKIFHTKHACSYRISDTSFVNYLTFPQYVVVVAMNVNGIILGYTICLVAIDEADVIYLYVDAKYRCRGIATQIFKYFMSSISGLKRMHLEVDVNNAEAINFYKKNEFKIIRIRKAYSNNSDSCEMIWCKVEHTV